MIYVYQERVSNDAQRTPIHQNSAARGSDSANVIALDIEKDFSAKEDQAKLKKGIECMIANGGRYLIHRAEGKSSTGFVLPVLEAFMGADIADIRADDLKSRMNFYHYTETSATCRNI